MTPLRLGILAAAVVAVGGGIGAAVTVGTDGGGGSDAQCPAEIVWSGDKYVGSGEVLRVPPAGDPLDPASTTACNGRDGVRPVAVTTITGIDSDVAVQTTDGAVYLRKSVERPAEVRELRTAYPCPAAAAGVMVTEGLLAGYDGGGEVRRPYGVVAWLDSGTGLPFDRYRRLVVTAAVGKTAGVSDDDVRRAVQEGTRVTATLRCDADRYVLTGLRLAP